MCWRTHCQGLREMDKVEVRSCEKIGKSGTDSPFRAGQLRIFKRLRGREKGVWPLFFDFFTASRSQRGDCPYAVPLYSERRKLRISCCCDGVRALKAATEPFASEPALECVWIACRRSVVLPSCRKKIRWPSPQSGAVRNSSGPAAP